MRRRSLAAAVQLLHRASFEDPFAGVLSERAFLYAPTSPPRSTSWGFDGTRGSSERVQVHRDGYSSAHVGPCAATPDVPLVERLIRQAGLDRRETEILRASFADPGRGSDWHALKLGMSLRTYQRISASIADKIRMVPAL